jgi:hypothetical protein
MQMKIMRTVLLPLFLLALFTCEDTLTSLIQEDVRIASLPDRTLTILLPSDGSVVPQGTITVKDGEPLNVAATPNSGFSFYNWVFIGGAGTVTFDDVNAASTTVSVSGGDAIIQPQISSTPRALTITNDGHGTTNPTGIVQVGEGLPRNIEAIPNGGAGYEFDTWSQVGGTGTASFDDSSDPTTTVTVTGDDVTIRAAFKLKHYTVTLTNDTHGTTSPSGPIDVIHGVATTSISTSPGTGYRFKNWTVPSGSGIAFNPNSTTSPVVLTATGGNATVQGNFELIPYELTINAGTGGYVSPSGAQGVLYGVAFQLHAYPFGTYKFVNWTKTAGTGTVVFSNSTDVNATATVTGGNATIQANFTKESVTLSQVGTLSFLNTTTYPSEAKDIYFYNNYWYILGTGVSGNSVVRRVNVSNPAAPSSIQGEDYRYVNGLPRALIGDGTYLFAGTLSTGGNIHRMTIASFAPGATITSASPAAPVLDLAIYPASATYLWAVTSSAIKEYTKSLYTGYYIINPDFGNFTYVEKTPFGLLAIQDDNGANQMSAYDVDGTSGATWVAPDSTIAVHGGADMDPGNAGRIAMHPDGEWVAVPVDDPYDGFAVRTYWTDDMYGISYRGQALLSGDPKQVHVEDYYMYVAAAQGGSAYIYIIDVYNPSAPVVRTSFQVTGFEWVDAVYVNGNYLYAVVDTAAAAKPTVKVYQIIRS